MKQLKTKELHIEFYNSHLAIVELNIHHNTKSDYIQEIVFTALSFIENCCIEKNKTMDDINITVFFNKKIDFEIIIKNKTMSLDVTNGSQGRVFEEIIQNVNSWFYNYYLKVV